MAYKHNHGKLILNSNTGIEYEYAVAYMLMTESHQTVFLNEVINNHPKTRKILDIIEGIDCGISLITEQWRDLPNYYVSLMPTQDDLLGGPSDILLCSGDTIHHGISIKFNNSNTWSPSAKYFLSDETISTLKLDYRTKYIPLYIEEMKRTCGKCEYLENSNRTTWYRKRCVITDLFIDKIRDAVIKSWGEKNLVEKIKIMKLGYHENTDIDCSIVTLKGDGTHKIEEMQMLPDTVSDIEIVKRKIGRLEFKVNGVVMGEMQVKPNGGFIQRDGNKNPFVVDECNYGEGNLFNSWNFEVIKKPHK